MQRGADLIITGAEDFDLRHIFECGQCFRWDRTGENEYTGVAFDKLLKISQQKNANNEIIMFNTALDEYEKIWYNYFDMGENYSDIKKRLCAEDEMMRTAAAAGEGIRILRQDVWETIVSFIISASNNIPRIKKIIALLCENFGEEKESEGVIYYTFPSAERLAPLKPEELSCIKAGFRDKYIIDAARRVCDGRLDIEELAAADASGAREKLKTVSGIGNKVADCVVLFGLHKTDAFPVDVWVKRIMEYCYFQNETAIPEISRFAKEKFGDLGGFAQQYLFYWARENKINV